MDNNYVNVHADMQTIIERSLKVLSHHKLVCYNILTKYVADNNNDISVGEVIETLDFLDEMFEHYKIVLKNRLDD